ncbi:MAG: 4,5-DOPA-extradiol-dioxygenase [Pseudobdellovibrionaceae bacterium]
MAKEKNNSGKMPVVFVGHGSPMNAIEKNQFGKELAALGSNLPSPKAILVISAHWQTTGSQVVEVDKPQTIHDFYGFPEKLFQVQYPAPGAPELAKRIQTLCPNVQLTQKWGLDHGAWSVLIHLFPKADIPVLQLSMNKQFTPQEHFAFAQNLKALREEGVLILGSGNIVHNLRMIKWEESAEVYPWALNFDQNIKKSLEERDIPKILDYEKIWPADAALSVPTSEHYLPLIYTLAVSDEEDQLSFPIERYEMGSLSMRSVLWKT